MLDHPVELERVVHIKFDKPNKVSEQRVHRKGNVRLKDGEVIQNVMFASFMIRSSDQVPVLNLAPGVTLPSGASSLPIQRVDEILFSQPTEIAPVTKAAGQGAGLLPGNDQPAELGELDPNKTMAENIFGTEEEYPMDSIDGDWGSASDYSYYEEDDGFLSGASERAGIFGFRLFGMAVGLVAFGIYMAAATLIGGIFLFISSRQEGVDDFPIWKSFLAAAALSFFPWLFFLLSVRFVPIFGLWLGFALLYGSSRAIVMGAMEVLEEKAEAVIWSFLMITTLVIILCVRYL